MIEIAPYKQPPLTLKESFEIIGGLSKTSKLPCHSWGLSTGLCKTGGKLKNIKDSPCAICYAAKGRYRFKQVSEAQKRREKNIEHPRWVEAMVTCLKHTIPIGVPYFRWFDSGDLQSEAMLQNIIEVANQLPTVNFWLPTQEIKMVQKHLVNNALPPNLVIRYSSPRINKPIQTYPNSYVATENALCPAPVQNGQCLECRACWDKNVKTVSYLKH